MQIHDEKKRKNRKALFLIKLHLSIFFAWSAAGENNIGVVVETGIDLHAQRSNQ
jgi:hypothetical protein